MPPSLPIRPKASNAIVLMDLCPRSERVRADVARAIHETVGSKVIFINGSKDQIAVARIPREHPTAVLFKPISGHQLGNAIAAARGGLPETGRRQICQASAAQLTVAQKAEIIGLEFENATSMLFAGNLGPPLSGGKTTEPPPPQLTSSLYPS